MKTLREFWSFANDATNLTDAEQLAKGQQNWSDLAADALGKAAWAIADRADYSFSHIDIDTVIVDADAITWALENHPQAFEELSLEIGAALERMWAVVPEAKREEVKPRSAGREWEHRADGALADFDPYKCIVKPAAKREEVKPIGMVTGIDYGRERGVAVGTPMAQNPDGSFSQYGTFSNLPETYTAKLREQMIANIQALRDSVVGDPHQLASMYPMVYAGEWKTQATAQGTPDGMPCKRCGLSPCHALCASRLDSMEPTSVHPSQLPASVFRSLVKDGYHWNELAQRWEHMARIER